MLCWYSVLSTPGELQQVEQDEQSTFILVLLHSFDFAIRLLVIAESTGEELQAGFVRVRFSNGSQGINEMLVMFDALEMLVWGRTAGQG